MTQTTIVGKSHGLNEKFRRPVDPVSEQTKREQEYLGLDRMNWKVPRKMRGQGNEFSSNANRTSRKMGAHNMLTSSISLA